MPADRCKASIDRLDLCDFRLWGRAAVAPLVGAILPFGYPFVASFLALLVTAFLFGACPEILAVLLACLSARYFFIEPHYDFGVGPGVRGAFFFFILVILVNLGIIHLVQRANRQVRE